MGGRRMRRFLIVVNLFVVGLCATAPAQDLQRWRHAVIEPKGDGGFSLMVAIVISRKNTGLRLKLHTKKWRNCH